mmetsp:Transcript_7492/g.15519  ORF Transcript_7492/g.15519 Transcript_7492/m.15519 type:complete len:448 (-) Transcript_7492:181-1524(-)
MRHLQGHLQAQGLRLLPGRSLQRKLHDEVHRQFDQRRPYGHGAPVRERQGEREGSRLGRDRHRTPHGIEDVAADGAARQAVGGGGRLRGAECGADLQALAGHGREGGPGRVRGDVAGKEVPCVLQTDVQVHPLPRNADGVEDRHVGDGVSRAICRAIRLDGAAGAASSVAGLHLDARPTVPDGGRHEARFPCAHHECTARVAAGRLFVRRIRGRVHMWIRVGRQHAKRHVDVSDARAPALRPLSVGESDAVRVPHGCHGNPGRVQGVGGDARRRKAVGKPTVEGEDAASTVPFLFRQGCRRRGAAVHPEGVAGVRPVRKEPGEGPAKILLPPPPALRGARVAGTLAVGGHGGAHAAAPGRACASSGTRPPDPVGVPPRIELGRAGETKDGPFRCRGVVPAEDNRTTHVFGGHVSWTRECHADLGRCRSRQRSRRLRRYLQEFGYKRF